ncbi:hypothetical protein [Paraburkholderia atlantica]|uniref:hypothetical protein n=1 Tax=Paraburkholderia atlantica TaxID=2654982 RepID=UPI001EE68ED7|nr:hypothetical protein [Paraburkholderia atlantica]
MSDPISMDLRLLAAIAYGEASTANYSNEIGGIAFAVANRCRAWGGKTVSELRTVDPNYAYAWNGSNQRFNKLMSTSDEKLDADFGMKLAVEWARKALENEGPDPANGAFGGTASTSRPTTRLVQRSKSVSSGAIRPTTFRGAGEETLVHHAMASSEQEDRKNRRWG